MNTKEPQNILYDSFSTIIDDKVSNSQTNIEDIKEALATSWTIPYTSKESSSLDIASIPEKFKRDDCQDDYKQYLKGEKIPIEATTIKLQNGFIEAEEQAYRLRHLSIPRALAMGIMEPTRWSNGFIPYILKKQIQNIGDLAKEDYKSKFQQNNPT